MISARIAVMAAAAAIGIAAPGSLPSAQAAPAPVALVIGNGTYAALPALSACLPSAHAVAAALRGAGFTVVEHEDATSGGIDAAIAETGRQLAGRPDAPALVYVCGYATSFNDRSFLLPVSANIARPTDVLTQGVLTKSLLGLLTRAGDRPALLVLDVVPAPAGPPTGSSTASPAGSSAAGSSPDLGLDALAQGTLPPGLGYIAASQGTPPGGPTPLAIALTTGLKATSVQIAPLLAGLRQQFGASKTVTIAALRAPTEPSYLTGAPPPPKPSPPPQAASVPAPAAPVTAAPPSPTMPAEDAMTDTDRRQVQTALARLGYYDGQVDGVFGPDTRAAIRRYQHELGAGMNGRLTATQASRLVAGR